MAHLLIKTELKKLNSQILKIFIMKKSSAFLMLTLSVLSFVSCTKNNELPIEDTCTKENFTVTFEKQIDEVLIEPTNWRYIGKTMHFSYNEYNLLERMAEGNIDSYLESNFKYKCNNQLNEMFNKEFQFNQQNKLINVTKEFSNKNLDLTYSGNTINLKGNMYSSDNLDITFVVNSENLVTKIQRVNNYSIIQYDSNGNMINAKDYDLNDVLLKEYQFEFDQNPNPFYGQLTSAYLERMYFYFQTSINDGINHMAYYADFDSYFPYFKNNIVKIIDKSKQAPYNVTMLREYTYDTDNYPTKYEYTVVGYHDSTVSITYK